MSCEEAHRFRPVLPYFQQFETNLNVLQSEVEKFNTWENDSRMANACDRNGSKRMLLKNLTQPRYHKIVAGMINLRENSTDKLKQSKNYRKLNPLESSALNLPTAESEGRFFQLASHQSTNLEKTKSLQLKSCIQRRQKKLLREWEKTENFRCQHHISFNMRPPKAHKKEESIIERVQLRRPNTCLSMTSDRSQSVVGPGG